MKRKSRFSKEIAAFTLLAFLLFSLFLLSSVTAQGTSISGTIQNEETLEYLEDVQVTVLYTHNQTIVGDTKSDSSGNYGISGLQEGTFNITFKIPGYKDRTETITLGRNQTKVLDVLLDDYKYDTDDDGIPDSDEWDKKDADAEIGYSGFPVCLQTIMILMIVLFLSLIMYSKIKQENLLKNAQRKRILDHIKENPGKHYRAILKDLDLPMGVLTYHLNRLEKGNFIRSRQDGMMRRFFPSGKKTEVKFFLSDIQESILNVVKENKGISQSKIAERIGV